MGDKNVQQQPKKNQGRRNRNNRRLPNPTAKINPDDIAQLSTAFSSHTLVEELLNRRIDSLQGQFAALAKKEQIPPPSQAVRKFNSQRRQLIQAQINNQRLAKADDLDSNPALGYVSNDQACCPEWSHAIFSPNLPLAATSDLDCVTRLYASKPIISVEHLLEYAVFVNPHQPSQGVEVWALLDDSFPAGMANEWVLYDIVPWNADISAISGQAAITIGNVHVDANTVSSTNANLAGSIRSGQLASFLRVPNVRPASGLPTPGCEQEFLVKPHVTPLTQIIEGNTVAFGRIVSEACGLDQIKNSVFDETTTSAVPVGTRSKQIFGDFSGTWSRRVVMKSAAQDPFYGAQYLKIDVALQIDMGTGTADVTDVLQLRLVIPFTTNNGVDIQEVTVPIHTINVADAEADAYTGAVNLSFFVDFPNSTRTCFATIDPSDEKGILLFLEMDDSTSVEFPLFNVTGTVNFSSPELIPNSGQAPVIFVSNLSAGLSFNVNANAAVAYRDRKSVV